METKDLNLIPSGSMPIVHASQFDDMRHIRFNLKDDEEEYTLESGITLECHLKKVDGNVVTFAVENTETKYIDVYFPQQATACAGPNVGEIVITDEENSVIGTINFILEVERSPMLGGIESVSDIHDLEEQIEVIVTQVIATDYYTKTEVDNLLNDKADISDLPDMDNYYDKSSVDTLLNGKANVSDLNNYYNKSQVDNLLDDKADISDLPDMTDYYTKTAVDNLLSNKADISDLPDMSNYYTKTQIDNKFLDIMPVNTISGAIANFNTSLALPLVALKAYIKAQGGGGTPTTPVAITGFDSVVITQADENMQTINTFTIQLGQTCYGGYVDKSTGKLVVTHNIIDFSSNSFTWSYDNSSNRWQSTLSNLKSYPTRSNDILAEKYQTDTTASSGSENKLFTVGGAIYIYYSDNVNKPTGNCVYPLATPIETDITLPDITALVGENNIFADSGDIDISFKQDIQNYVDSKISAINANRTLSMIRPVNTEESKGDENER